MTDQASVLAADVDALERFVDLVFGASGPRGRIELRMVGPGGELKDRAAIPWRGNARAVAQMAAVLADRNVADEGGPWAFAPPVCLFDERGWKADQKHVVSDVALVLDLDKGDIEGAQTRLADVLGDPSLVVYTGGVSDGVRRRHLYWIWDEACVDSEAWRTGKEIRRLATLVAGDAADRSGMPVVHPFRWPGTWNTKSTPVMARMEGDGRRVPRAKILEALKAATAGMERAVTVAGRTDDRETEALLEDVLTGKEIHSSQAALAMRLARIGLPQGVNLSLQRGLLRGVADRVDPTRWQDRWDEVERVVGSAYAKLAAEILTDEDDESIESGEVAWQAKLTKNEEGRILLNHKNLYLILRYHEDVTGRFRRNLLDDRIDVMLPLPWSQGGGLRPLDNDDLTAVAGWLVDVGVSTMNTGSLHEAVSLVARRQAYDPLRDWLMGLEWDGRPRVDRALETYFGAAGDPRYVREASRVFFLQLAARGVYPGCQADVTLILEGDQGIRKTTACRVLAMGDKRYTSLSLEVGGRDTMMVLRGMQIVELGELTAVRRSDMQAVKDFLSARADRFRAPYDRVERTIPRRCVFVGTVNPDGAGYLTDNTGNRRFLPVDCRGVKRVAGKMVIDTDALERDRDQLLAEAVHRLGAGEPWHTVEGALMQLAHEETEARRTEHPWKEIVHDWLRANEYPVVSTKDALRAVGAPLERNARGSEMEMSAVLKSLGYQKFKTGGYSRWRCPMFD